MRVYIPHALAERCYLSEALYWLALYRLPVASFGENGVDRREDAQEMEGIEEDPPFDSTVTADECERVGLPVNPRWELLDAGGYHAEPAAIRKRLEFKLNEDVRRKYEEELRASLAFHDRQTAWDKEFDQFLDGSAMRLFQALCEGRLGATGKRISKSTIAESLEELENHDWHEWSAVPWEPIPPDFWVSFKIRWRESRAEGRGRSYFLILVETEELLRAFPMPTDQVVRQVTELGYFLVLYEGEAVATGRPARGRKPLNWDEFHVEVTKRFIAGTVPTKQEAFVAEMREWCIKRWQRSVGRSTLVEKLKPYYDALVRKSQNADG